MRCPSLKGRLSIPLCSCNHCGSCCCRVRWCHYSRRQPWKQRNQRWERTGAQGFKLGHVRTWPKKTTQSEQFGLVDIWWFLRIQWFLKSCGIPKSHKFSILRHVFSHPWLGWFEGARHFRRPACFILDISHQSASRIKHDTTGSTWLLIWLVLYLPLWNIWVRQLRWWHSQYMEKCSKPPTSDCYSLCKTQDCFAAWINISQSVVKIRCISI